jgi:hypothetical protein
LPKVCRLFGSSHHLYQKLKCFFARNLS